MVGKEKLKIKAKLGLLTYEEECYYLLFVATLEECVSYLERKKRLHASQQANSEV